MTAAARPAMPRLPALAIATLLLLALGAAAWTRVTGVGASTSPPAAETAVRELRFEDRPDGGIAVLDAAGAPVAAIAAGEQGFLRSTMRGFARDRKRRGLGPELPFRLSARADGRLVLDDPATGRSVDLGSFGPTNAATFARLMAAPHAAPL